MTDRGCRGDSACASVGRRSAEGTDGGRDFRNAGTRLVFGLLKGSAGSGKIVKDFSAEIGGTNTANRRVLSSLVFIALDGNSISGRSTHADRRDGGRGPLFLKQSPLYDEQPCGQYR